MSVSLQIPENLFKQLVEAAEAAGTTPVEWIQARLPAANKPQRVATPQEIAEANSRLEKCIVDLGYPTGTDNEQIDADLAEEYLNAHDSVTSDRRGR